MRRRPRRTALFRSVAVSTPVRSGTWRNDGCVAYPDTAAAAFVPRDDLERPPFSGRGASSHDFFMNFRPGPSTHGGRVARSWHYPLIETIRQIVTLAVLIVIRLNRRTIP